MTEKIDMDKFVDLIAHRARFSKRDVKIILATIVEIFEDCVRDDVTLKVRGLGKLFSILLPERKGAKGIHLPPTRKVMFRLADNIRNQKHNTPS